MMDPRLMNQPVRLWWAGWETDTYALGSRGWQISVEQDVQYNRMRIAINHPEARVQGISTVEEFLFQDIMKGRCNPTLPVMLRFETMAQVIHINSMRDREVEFTGVDYRPQMMEMEIKQLSDFAHFTTVPEEAKHEIYLHEANINQILEMALQRQEPDQERIRKEMMHGQEMEKLRMGTLHTELRMVA